MATTELSMTVKKEALEMALQANTWNRGTSKRDRRPFYLIPSRSEPNVAHYTTSYGCTCKGHRRYGDCAHAEAVRMYEGHQQAQQRITAYTELYPSCRVAGCTNDPEPGSADCYRHELCDAF